MGKRKPSISDAQLTFSFDPPKGIDGHDGRDGALGDIDRMVAAAVSRMLGRCGASRWVIAGQVSAILGDEVSKLMLDAYASESRDGHNISAGRLLALVAATNGHAELDALVGRIGGRILWGEEVWLAEMGHLEAQEREIKARKAALKGLAQPLRRGK